MCALYYKEKQLLLNTPSLLCEVRICLRVLHVYGNQLGWKTTTVGRLVV